MHNPRLRNRLSVLAGLLAATAILVAVIGAFVAPDGGAQPGEQRANVGGPDRVVDGR